MTVRDHCQRYTGESLSGGERVAAEDLWRRPAELRAYVTFTSLLFWGKYMCFLVLICALWEE